MILRFLLIFFVISACVFSPGFKKEPSSKNPKRLGLEQNGVTLFFHNINKMNLGALPSIGDIQKKSQENTIKTKDFDKWSSDGKAERAESLKEFEKWKKEQRFFK